MERKNSMIKAFALAGACMLGASGCSEEQVGHEDSIQHNTKIGGVFVPQKQFYIEDAATNVIAQTEGSEVQLYLVTGESETRANTALDSNDEPYTHTSRGGKVGYRQYLHLQDLNGETADNYVSKQIQKFKRMQQLASENLAAGSLEGEGQAGLLGGTNFNIEALSGMRVADIKWSTLEETDRGHRVLMQDVNDAPGIYTLSSLADTWDQIYQSLFNQKAAPSAPNGPK